jgi:two-component system, NtrC family, response regulator AtoC
VALARTIGREGGGAKGKLQLLVVEGDSVTLHDLPDLASILIGRGAQVDIQLADPSASARHARLYVDGDSILIEDLASRNGTQVRGQRITADARVPLATGEAAMLGSAVLIVQHQSAGSKRRRSWPHGYFEMRLTEECELSGGGNATFSVARLDFDRGLSADAFVEAAESALRPSDIIGIYGPGAFEILFRRTTPEGAQGALEILLAKLASLAPPTVEPRVAFAHFPADGQTAHALVEKACAGVRPSPVAAPRPGIIVLDPRMWEIYRLAEKAAAGSINVLILGETGVGKEILAETIHRASKRAERPFLCLNCAALTENLLESELFGHERGAFTDAKTAKPGLLETAAGGTVFLDEIGEMSPTLQAKLLRVIETKEVTRVGGLRPTAIDVRFVSATHRDLVEEIREKRFRSDLYYRLNGIGLEIPPLRERASEIRPLCEAFLAQFAETPAPGPAPRLTEEAISILESHVWPGNIRELRNVMERALLLSDGGDIEPDHLPIDILRARPNPAPVSIDDLSVESDDRWNRQEKAERARIVEALKAEGGNQSRAARRLGMARGTLLVRLETYNIGRPIKR